MPEWSQESAAPLRLVRRDRPAVVGQREVDDGPRLESSGSQVHAPRRSAERCVEGGSVVEVHQRIGRLRPPAGHVQRGQVAGRPDQRLPQPAVGLAHVRQLARRRLEGPPLHRLALLLRHQPERACHDGLAGLHGRLVEAARTAEAQRVAVDGQCQSGVRRPAGARGRQQVERRAAVEQVGVVGQHIEDVVGLLVSAQPRGHPPGEGGRVGEGRRGRHRGRGYSVVRDRRVSTGGALAAG